MIVAITGSTSMIGLDLVKAHLSSGDNVIAIVRSNSDKINKLPITDKVTVIQCDNDNYSSLHDLCKCDVFYHLAWSKTSVKDRDDIQVQFNNIQYTLDAVRLAYNWSAKKFIGAGSQAEFGVKNGPLSEKTCASPESAYGISKYASGMLSGLLCKQLGMHFNWTRILSAYGENDREGTLVKYLVKSFLNGDAPELTPCEQIWDYIYSEDVASAFKAISVKGVDGKTYVIGSGHGEPLKNYVKTIADVLGADCTGVFGKKDYPPHQPMMLYSDISELTKDTGFVPKYSFEDGIKRVINNMKNNS